VGGGGPAGKNLKESKKPVNDISKIKKGILTSEGSGLGESGAFNCKETGEDVAKRVLAPRGEGVWRKPSSETSFNREKSQHGGRLSLA